MGNRYIKDLLLVLCGVFLLVTMYSCANMASPNGGPYDETPPKSVSYTHLTLPTILRV